MELLEVIWFNTIGIVLVDTGYGLKSYIGNGNGYNADTDTQYIMAYGNKFPPNAAVALFGSRYKIEDFAK